MTDHAALTLVDALAKAAGADVVTVPQPSSR
jgi:hypothetical protein